MFISLSFFSVFLLDWLYPVRIDGIAVGFDNELAHKAKHAEIASETQSQPDQKGFSGFG